MGQSRAAGKLWRTTDLNNRCSSLRQLLAKLSSVETLDEFADDLEQTLNDKTLQDPVIKIGDTSIDFTPYSVDLTIGDNDEIAIFSRALSAEEISELYQIGKP